MQNFFPLTTSQKETKFTSRLLASKLSIKKYSQILESIFESTAEINRKVFDDDNIYEFDRDEIKDLVTNLDMKIIDSEFRFGVMQFRIKI